MRKILLVLIFLLSLGVPAVAQTAPASAQAAAAQNTEVLVALLPDGLRAEGGAVLAQPDERRRAALARALIRKDATATLDFALALLGRDPSPRVRAEIIERMPRIEDPRFQHALQQVVSGDSSPPVISAALERLRIEQARVGLSLIDERLKSGNPARGTAEYLALAAEQERWAILERGGRLPSFLSVPPPLFSLKPDGRPVRVLAFGDYGDGSATQQKVAAAMLKYHRDKPFDFGITVGDNFYSRGMESPDDPRWKTWWNELYDPMGIRIYATLGNHDWGMPDSPAAEMMYSLRSPSFRMPATRYTFAAGPVQFFAIDSNILSEAQLLWLEGELKKSTARWKVVYGHHPIYSHGQYGNNTQLMRHLLPVLAHRADIYIAGHEHDLQHLKPQQDVHFFVTGGGGAGIRAVKPGENTLFAQGVFGFTVLEADASQFTVRYFDSDMAPLYEYTIKKP